MPAPAGVRRRPAIAPMLRRGAVFSAGRMPISGQSTPRRDPARNLRRVLAHLLDRRPDLRVQVGLVAAPPTRWTSNSVTCASCPVCNRGSSNACLAIVSKNNRGWSLTLRHRKTLHVCGCPVVHEDASHRVGARPLLGIAQEWARADVVLDASSWTARLTGTRGVSFCGAASTTSHGCSSTAWAATCLARRASRTRRLHTGQDAQVTELLVRLVAGDGYQSYLNPQVWASVEEVREDLRKFLARIPRGVNWPDLAFFQLITWRLVAPWAQSLAGAGHLLAYPYLDLDYVRTAMRIDPVQRIEASLQALSACSDTGPAYFAFSGSRRISPDAPVNKVYRFHLSRGVPSAHEPRDWPGGLEASVRVVAEHQGTPRRNGGPVERRGRRHSGSMASSGARARQPRGSVSRVLLGRPCSPLGRISPNGLGRDRRRHVGTPPLTGTSRRVRVRRVQWFIAYLPHPDDHQGQGELNRVETFGRAVGATVTGRDCRVVAAGLEDAPHGPEEPSTPTLIIQLTEGARLAGMGHPDSTVKIDAESWVDAGRAVRSSSMASCSRHAGCRCRATRWASCPATSPKPRAGPWWRRTCSVSSRASRSWCGPWITLPRWSTSPLEDHWPTARCTHGCSERRRAASSPGIASTVTACRGRDESSRRAGRSPGRSLRPARRPCGCSTKASGRSQDWVTRPRCCH